MPPTQDKKEQDQKISHYRLTEPLVEQTVSVIYLAQDEKTNNTVFLITLQPEAIRSSDLADRFQRRVETLAHLEHEVIPPLLDYGVDGKRPFAVMAYLPGQFLADHLKNTSKPDPQEKDKIVESLTLVKKIANGLTIMHPAGLIHHDLRPENIYLGEFGQPYLLDMVVPPIPATTQPDAENLTELDYQSPEQLAGKALSGRSNIYSLGILLYHLLAGQKPALPVSEWDIFEHKGTTREIPLQQVQPGLAEATYLAVQDSIWQKEWSRYETAKAQAQAIERAIFEESTPPPPPPPVWLVLLNRLRQPKTLRIIVPAVVLLFLLLLVLMFVRGRANRQGNIAPTPDAAVATQQPENDLTIQPTVTTADTNEDTSSEDEVLPLVEETDTTTASPRPTETAVATSTIDHTPTPTTSPTVEAISTPTLESTEVGCIPTPPFGWVRYDIKANDSLSALGQATNTTVEQLMQVNCLDRILLSIGQTIWLPALTPPATP